MHRSHLGNGNVDTHIPLHTSDKHRVIDVSLQYALLVVLEVVNIVYNRDAAAPRQICRFANPLTLFIPISVEKVDELLVLIGQYEGKRREVVNIPMQLLLLLDYPRQIVFRANGPCLGNMTKFLIRFCPFELTQGRSEKVEIQILSTHL